MEATFSFKRGSQDSRGTPSAAPSCGPSSSNALLSEIIRLDDEDENWLKGQLMVPPAAVQPERILDMATQARAQNADNIKKENEPMVA